MTEETEATLRAKIMQLQTDYDRLLYVADYWYRRADRLQKLIDRLDARDAENSEIIRRYYSGAMP